MIVPETVPGVADESVAQELRPRWTRARRSLVTASVVCPVALAVLCTGLVLLTGVLDGFAWWFALPVVGVGIPVVLVLGGLRRMVFEPPRWVRTAALCGMGQLLLGVFPAVGVAVRPGGVLAAVATVVFVVSLTLVVAGVVAARKALRTLLTPLSPALGASPFTVAVRPRLHDTGLRSGSISITRDGVEWAARRHRATGHGSLPFSRIRSMRPTVLPDAAGPAPWLGLSDGTTADATPGPAAALDTDAGPVLLPVDDPRLVLDLLGVRIATR
ncbi:hypothetical protein [Saccharomonospora iraqiensis]|uniref:hypothetical protein n=1 Tax=Saccharomonospora iraqiensis TaxID=52698 RepID=UPI00022E756D|nr:hypothetical protein [Saccharomonospora iraqiensis]